MKIVLVTGGFDPIHSGHIQYFKHAKKMGDALVVGINSNDWLTRKKGKYFMDWSERAAIIRHLDMVDAVIDFDDTDDSAINAIEKALELYPHSKIIFANGGDRTKDNIPEMTINSDRVEFVFAVGGDSKLNSSSDILKRWDNKPEPEKRTKRQWGSWSVLKDYDNHGVKVKELEVKPHSFLSMQRHFERNEYWLVVEGVATLRREGGNEVLQKHQGTLIPVKEWHQLANMTDNILRVVEIQWGSRCEEDDIQRK